METLRNKISEYVEAGAMDEDQAARVLTHIESERGVRREGNRIGDEELVGADGATTATQNTLDELYIMDCFNTLKIHRLF